jgi:hypothetical protein
MYLPTKTPHPVRLYDTSILNIQERRERALDFPTIADAAKYLGVAPNTVRNNIGSRVMSHKLGKRYAVRALSEPIQKRA